MKKPSSEKTEPPTPKRLREARKKGQVAKSKEMVSAAIIILLLFYFGWSGEYHLWLFNGLIDLPKWIGQVTFPQALEVMTSKTLWLTAAILLPPLGIVLVSAIAVNFVQIGGLIAPKAALPDTKRLNPATALKNIFSMKNLVELIKSIVKISILGIVVTYVLWNGMPALLSVLPCGLDCMMSVLGALFREMAIYVSVTFLLVAIADFSFQKHAHLKELKMTKDEVKREFKDTEGDPEIKGRRRSLFMEVMNTHESANVRRSSLIVANPIHLAVGLYYEEDVTPLPVVTLKEQGLNARRVVEIAEKEEIPVIVNVPLAHSLTAHADLDRYIPGDLVGPVAEVLNLVRELKA